MPSPIDRAYQSIGKMTLSVLELMPTRGEMLYACLNMPWRIENWRGLKAFWGNTKRGQQKLRRDLEDHAHITWARELARGKA
ncbi:hypothetical protein FF47_62 [Mycobacterium phage FF47]|uniref:Uncharacterized protein n=1 Tax=Mycobacterium phage FF47 TaxID=1305710 RepID=M4W9V8_9CAUD|nr:hypothetical protein FF47_62 [Mycobacterium phage FF47]AGI12334.1 hypothetical protein FF47_62 [Mycobacterium phage FF47]WKV22122.1 hypothetical protein 8UZL_00004 [Mycobacteroides phage 8UZL]